MPWAYDQVGVIDAAALPAGRQLPARPFSYSPVYLLLILSPGVASESCSLFPADNIWNARVDSLPVDQNSANYINSIGAGVHLHADFGSGLWDGGPIGIPFIIVPGSQPMVAISFGTAGESDPGPYPIPPDAPIEGGTQSRGDQHVLVVDQGSCSNWFISGSPDERWNNDQLANVFNQIHDSNFEAVDVSSLMLNPDTGQVR